MTNQPVIRDELLMAARQQATYGIPEYVFLAWKSQRHSAGKRGIEFWFTLLQWHWWWRDALLSLGPDAKRGRRKGQFVMARIGDQGAYEAGNVYAATPKQNARDIPSDVRVAMAEGATATRQERGKPLGAHLKVRGDGHPRSIPIRTPVGRFGSIALAAEAHGITRQAGHYRVQRGVWTYCS